MKFQHTFLGILFVLSCLSCSSKKHYLEKYLEELKEEHSLKETPKLYVNDELVEYGQESEGWLLLKEEDIISKDFYSKEWLNKHLKQNRTHGILHVSTRFSEPPNSKNHFDYPKYINGSAKQNKTLQKLNDEIYNSHLEAVKISDLKSGKGMGKEIELQRIHFRNKYLHSIQELRKEFPEKPLILLESYPFICTGCGADHVLLYNEEVLIRMRLLLEEGRKLKEISYEVMKASKDISKKQSYMNNGFLTLYNAALKDENWNRSSLRYGTDQCFDGGQSFYTIISPDGTMKSMYMRCWTGKQEKQ